MRAIYSDGRWQDAPVFLREALVPGHQIDSPDVVIEATSTTVVDPGWRATLTARDHLVLERVVPLEGGVAVGTGVDPVMLEIFNNIYMSIAQQFGAIL